MRSVLSTESAVGSTTTSWPCEAPRALGSACGAVRSKVGGAAPPPQAASANANANAAPKRHAARKRHPITPTAIPCASAERSASTVVLRHLAAAAAEYHP